MVVEQYDFKTGKAITQVHLTVGLDGHTLYLSPILNPTLSQPLYYPSPYPNITLVNR